MQNVLMSAVMNLLPKEYEAVADRTELTSVAALKNAILDKHDRLNAQAEAGGPDVPMAHNTMDEASVQYAKGKDMWNKKGKNKGSDKGKGKLEGKGRWIWQSNECHLCGEYGHWQQECPSKKGVASVVESLSVE